jgi:hypothetical protein
MFNVYLDDERATPPEFDVRTVTVPTTCDFLRINQGDVDILSLDNDLGIPHWLNEGRYITLWLAEQQNLFGRSYWPRRIRIHSANPVAREYMRGNIERYGPYRWDVANQEYVDDSRF